MFKECMLAFIVFRARDNETSMGKMRLYLENYFLDL